MTVKSRKKTAYKHKSQGIGDAKPEGTYDDKLKALNDNKADGIADHWLKKARK